MLNSFNDIIMKIDNYNLEKNLASLYLNTDTEKRNKITFIGTLDKCIKNQKMEFVSKINKIGKIDMKD